MVVFEEGATRVPTVLRLEGFVFRIYYGDHEPPHVHVFRGGEESVILLGDDASPPSLRETYMSRARTKRALELVWETRRRSSRDGGRSMGEMKRVHTIDDATFDDEFERARRRGVERDRTEPRAVRARYDVERGKIVVELANGAEFAVPPELVEGLAGASAEALADVEVTPGGRGLHWERLDADHSVPALVAGLFGTRAWMSELGRRGGRARSEAKAEAVRENGRKGGRPRKTSAA